MMKNARMPVHELNPYLTCVLCGGYLIDATTIIECLHSFCRTCIVHYLHTSNYCPVCECLVHKKHPHQNLRSDKTLQDVVYKLVPGLFMEEMRRRRQYYNIQADESQSKSGRIIFSPDEKISLCVRLCTGKICARKREDDEFQNKRYLLCPAQMSVSNLKKFLRLKYCLSDRLEVEMFHLDEVLKDEYSLMDVSYITGWRREKVMVLNYAFYENPSKKFKTNSFSGAVSPSNDDSGIEDENSNQDGGNNPDQNHVTSQSSPAASRENDNQQSQTDGENTPSDSLSVEISKQVLETAADADDVNSNAVNNARQSDANQDKSEEKEIATDDCVDNNDVGIQDGEDYTENKNDDNKSIEKEESGESGEMEDSCSLGDRDQCKDGEGIKETSEAIETETSSQGTPNVHENDNQIAASKNSAINHTFFNEECINDSVEESQSESPDKDMDLDNDTCSSNTELGKVRSPKSHGIAFEDEEGVLQIDIDDSKSEKSSFDSGYQLSENSSKENDSLCSVESKSPAVTIKIPNPEIISRNSPVPLHNGVRNHRTKSPKTSTPLHSLQSPSRKFPRFSESLSFTDSGYSPYKSLSDSIPRAMSCPQTDFDADEIWTDGVMDLSKPKVKVVESSQFQEAKMDADESEEVEKYTYVADDLEEGDGNMAVDSGYANENKTPERYSLISPDQNEVTSTRGDHMSCHAPLVADRPPEAYAPKFTAVSDFVWKIDKSSADLSKKSTSSGKHHKRRRSSEGSKHKVALSKLHSKCTDVCNGHSVMNHSHISTSKNKHCEKLILNQPRCEKLIISQSRCAKVQNNKPRCEKLVVKLSKERNSEHYTATIS